MTHQHDDKRKAAAKARLRNARVTHISLVDRPANMRRFAIIKQEDSGMNLRKMLGLDAKGPRVAAVFATTEAGATSLAQKMNVAGAVEKIADDLYSVGESKEECLPVLNVDGSGYMIEGVENATKMLSSYASGTLDFKSIVAQEGFMPSFHTALSAMFTTVQNAAGSDEVKSAKDLRAILKTAISDFGAYVDSLASNLPETAFKHEVAGMLPVAKTEEEPDASDTQADADTVDEKADADTVEDKGGASNITDEKPGDVAVLIQTMKELTDAMPALVEKMTALSGDVSRVQEGLEEVRASAKKATDDASDVRDTLRKTVGGAGTAPLRAVKSDRSGEPPLIDTAFERAG